jgi:hypothetical protein
VHDRVDLLVSSAALIVSILVVEHPGLGATA